MKKNRADYPPHIADLAFKYSEEMVEKWGYTYDPVTYRQGFFDFYELVLLPLKNFDPALFKQILEDIEERS